MTKQKAQNACPNLILKTTTMARPFTTHRPVNTNEIADSLVELFENARNEPDELPSDTCPYHRRHVTANAGGRDGEVLGLLYHLAETCSKNIGVVHRGITCDGCGQSPVIGTRYHCSECVDVDLCQHCVTLNKHEWSHVLIKIKIPAPLQFSPQWICEPWTLCDNRAIVGDLSDVLGDEETHTLSAATGVEPNAIRRCWRKFSVLCDSVNETKRKSQAPDPSFVSYKHYLSHNKLISLYTIARNGKRDITQQNLVKLYNRSGDREYVSFRDFLTVEHWFDSSSPLCELQLITSFFGIKQGVEVDQERLVEACQHLMTTITTQQVWWGQVEERDVEEVVTGPGPVSARFQEYNDFIKESFFERKKFSPPDEPRDTSVPPSLRLVDPETRLEPRGALSHHFGTPKNQIIFEQVLQLTAENDLMAPFFTAMSPYLKNGIVGEHLNKMCLDADSMMLVSRIASLIRRLRG